LIPESLPVIDRLSSERIANEIERIFAEIEPEAALVMLDVLNVLQRVDVHLQADDWLIAACRALRWCFDSTMPDALNTNYWAILACRIENMKRLTLPKPITDAINQTRRLYLGFNRLAGDESPSVYVPIFEGCPVFAAWAIAPLAAHRTQLEAFQNHWRHIYPTLTGDDLKAMGLHPGPVFRTILHRLRNALLDGEINTPTEERALVQLWLDQNVIL
jgi:tRNA nucleotidyltransferase (CCA-adding enzyme)